MQWGLHQQALIFLAEGWTHSVKVCLRASKHHVMAHVTWGLAEDRASSWCKLKRLWPDPLPSSSMFEAYEVFLRMIRLTGCSNASVSMEPEAIPNAVQRELHGISVVVVFDSVIVFSKSTRDVFGDVRLWSDPTHASAWNWALQGHMQSGNPQYVVIESHIRVRHEQAIIQAKGLQEVHFCPVNDQRGDVGPKWDHQISVQIVAAPGRGLTRRYESHRPSLQPRHLHQKAAISSLQADDLRLCWIMYS